MNWPAPGGCTSPGYPRSSAAPPTRTEWLTRRYARLAGPIWVVPPLELVDKDVEFQFQRRELDGEQQVAPAPPADSFGPLPHSQHLPLFVIGEEGRAADA